MDSVLEPAALAMAGAALALTALTAWLLPGEWARLGLIGAGLASALGALHLARIGRPRVGSWVLVGGLWCVLTVVLLIDGIGGPARSGYLAAIVAAALLLGRGPAIGVTASSVAAALSIAALHSRGVLPLVVVPFSASWLRGAEAVFIVMGGVFVALAAQRIRSALDATSLSERKLSGRNEQLRESVDQLTRLRAAVDQAGDAIVVAESSGRISYANPAFAELMGVDAEQLETLGVYGLAAQSDDRALVEDMRTTVERGEIWQRRYDTLWNDGSRFKRDATVAPVRNAAGELAHFVGVFRDITAIAEREEQAIQRQKLESLGVMAGGIAHDFNNLLTVILGNSALALESLPDGHPASGSVRQAVEASEAAAELTRQLLAYAGGARAEPQLLDLSDFVRSRTSLITAAASPDVRLKIDLADGLPLLLADPAQLQQIALNLVANAAAACSTSGANERAKGEVTVRTGIAEDSEGVGAARLIQAAGFGSGPNVFLEVRDNGVGIDTSTRARILDPFYSTKPAGRGLGLAVVARAVDALQGSLLLESQLGVGSAFRALFPPAKGSLEESRPDEPVAGLAGARILIVDDEPDVLAFAVRVLEEAGAETIASTHPDRALSALSADSNRIDLAILDLAMPDVRGDILLRRLRAIRPGLPAILTSGYSEAIATGGTGELDASGFLQKPYRPETLTRRVAEALRRSQPSAASAATAPRPGEGSGTAS